MAKNYPAGSYFVIATDDNTGLVVDYASDPDSRKADLKKVEFEDTRGFETCTITIEFKMAELCPSLDQLTSLANFLTHRNRSCCGVCILFTFPDNGPFGAENHWQPVENPSYASGSLSFDVTAYVAAGLAGIRAMRSFWTAVFC